jgi:8-oxo-dGTP pyrophosphatase MutT (NUDIX family)
VSSSSPALTKPPVRPRNAASLILLRGQGGKTEVLMGRRRPKASFIPDAFVFPGGRMDAQDILVEPSSPLSSETLENLIAKAQCTPNEARGLATAAIREMYEETGLWLAEKGDVGSKADGDWQEFRARGLAPAHGKLSYLGRAITPPDSPIRFHARFFIASADDISGDLGGSGELLDLGWHEIDKALKLPIIDVTEFMLGEIRARVLGQTRNGAPFFCYRANRPLIRYL